MPFSSTIVGKRVRYGKKTTRISRRTPNWTDTRIKIRRHEKLYNWRWVCRQKKKKINKFLLQYRARGYGFFMSFYFAIYRHIRVEGNRNKRMFFVSTRRYNFLELLSTEIETKGERVIVREEEGAIPVSEIYRVSDTTTTTVRDYRIPAMDWRVHCKGIIVCTRCYHIYIKISPKGRISISFLRYNSRINGSY